MLYSPTLIHVVILMTIGRNWPAPIQGLPHSSRSERIDQSPADSLAKLMSASPRFQSQSIHSWYTSVMAFPDHLVDSILESFSPSEDAIFFDPYCGSGTALVQAQQHGLRVFGVDASPSGVLASKVKTDWSIDLPKVRTAIDSFDRDIATLEASSNDPIVSYLEQSGMIDRGWIANTVATKAAAIKRWIEREIPDTQIYRFFMLALITSIVRDVSNVRFGPELYCVPAREEEPDVGGCVTTRLKSMVEDLESLDPPRTVVGQVRLGDSRDGRSIRTAAAWGDGPAYIITSPPYPTEHDYTRNARLELVFMEAVTDIRSLRRIKRRMIRSHSKGIYVGDRDSDFVKEFEPVQRIRRQIEDRINKKSSGFEGQYSKVVSNYFGGMLRHFRTLSNYLPVDSRLAYVVGDEASYKRVYIPTAKLLAEMVETYVTRLKIDNLTIWRSRRSYGDRQPLSEHVILFRVE